MEGVLPNLLAWVDFPCLLGAAEGARNEIPYFIAFNIFLLAMLALDLGVFHRHSHTIRVREALIWTAIWVAIAMAFNAGIYFHPDGGSTKAKEFFAGYVLEKSLSVDNIFVMVLIFGYFKVPPQYQHKVLFWGILGALVMRLAFILAGVALIKQFHWMIYVFGAFLIFTGIKMAFSGEKEIDFEHTWVMRLCRKFFRVTPGYVEGKFFTHIDGRRAVTPLFLALMFVEATDLLFAVDSIPAVLAVTSDPFIVYSSNALAILGLRSLYFAVGGLMAVFRFLQLGLAIILTFVGVKMLLSETDYKIDTNVALAVIAGVLVITVVASLIWSEQHPNEPPDERTAQLEAAIESQQQAQQEQESA